MTSPDRFAAQPYDATDHVLAAHLSGVEAAHDRLGTQLDEATLARRRSRRCPDEWLETVPGAETGDAVSAAYVRFLSSRLAQPARWLPQVRAA